MINLPLFDVIVYLYLNLWPGIAVILLLLIIGLWRRRSDWPTVYAILVFIEIVGSIPVGIYWGLEWRDALQASREVDYWDSVSDAINSDDPNKAIQLLTSRKNGLREYVEFGVRDENKTPNAVVLRAAFNQCVDLLDYRTDSISYLLAEAVKKGHPEIVETWLDTPPCADKTRQQEEGIASILQLLVPYPGDDGNATQRQTELRQAQALRLLVERYPALTDAPLSDHCDENHGAAPDCPTLVTALLNKWHREGVATVLPLDAHASQHLPPVVLHVLRGEERAAAQSAKDDPEVFHRYLPSLLATAPLNSLRAALRAAPPDERTLLTPERGDSLYQHLSPLFNAAKRRDADDVHWAFLWMLFDMFPTRLRDVDISLYDGYLIRRHPGDVNLDLLMTKLRSAGLDCDGFSHLAVRGDFSDTGQDRQWYQEKSGCRR